MYFPELENPNQNTMKRHLITAALASLFFVACEKTEKTTIQTPGPEKKDTVIVTPPAGGSSTSEKKTEKSETTIHPGGTTTEKKTETETTK